MSMNEEITQAIQKNLPAAVAGELKTYLAQAERDKETIVTLTAKKEELESRCKKGDAAYSELDAKLKAHQALDEREKAITKKENDLAVTLANSAALAAEQRANNIHDLVATIFRNTTVRRSLQQGITTTTDYNNGQTIRTPVGHTVNEETHEE